MRKSFCNLCAEDGGDVGWEVGGEGLGLGLALGGFSCMGSYIGSVRPSLCAQARGVIGAKC